jgi:hypothetical protein
MDDMTFAGFMPAIKNIEITPPTSMITTEGSLINGHVIKLTFGDDKEVIFSTTEDQLQKLFFLILKTINK